MAMLRYRDALAGHPWRSTFRGVQRVYLIKDDPRSRERGRGGAMVVRRDSDVAAFSEFVAARSGSLLRTASLVIGDYQLAQDLVQESLIKAYVAWPRIRDLTSAEAY